MGRCIACAAEIPDAARFCPKCGARQSEPVASVSSDVMTSAPPLPVKPVDLNATIVDPNLRRQLLKESDEAASASLPDSELNNATLVGIPIPLLEENSQAPNAPLASTMLLSPPSPGDTLREDSSPFPPGPPPVGLFSEQSGDSAPSGLSAFVTAHTLDLDPFTDEVNTEVSEAPERESRPSQTIIPSDVETEASVAVSEEASFDTPELTAERQVEGPPRTIDLDGVEDLPPVMVDAEMGPVVVKKTGVSLAKMDPVAGSVEASLAQKSTAKAISSKTPSQKPQAVPKPTGLIDSGLSTMASIQAIRPKPPRQLGYALMGIGILVSGWGAFGPGTDVISIPSTVTSNAGVQPTLSFVLPAGVAPVIDQGKTKFTANDDGQIQWKVALNDSGLGEHLVSADSQVAGKTLPIKARLKHVFKLRAVPVSVRNETAYVADVEVAPGHRLEVKPGKLTLLAAGPNFFGLQLPSSSVAEAAQAGQDLSIEFSVFAGADKAPLATLTRRIALVTQPNFLQVWGPIEGCCLSDKPLRVMGRTLPDAKVTLGKIQVKADEDGLFEFNAAPLTPGLHELELSSTSPLGLTATEPLKLRSTTKSERRKMVKELRKRIGAQTKKSKAEWRKLIKSTKKNVGNTVALSGKVIEVRRIGVGANEAWFGTCDGGKGCVVRAQVEGSLLFETGAPIVALGRFAGASKMPPGDENEAFDFLNLESASVLPLR